MLLDTDLDEEQRDLMDTVRSSGDALLDVINRRVLDLQLSEWGLRTTCASGPEEAIELIAGGATFDLAILDMHMPVMDGEQLASEIRRQPGGQEMPLVMLRSLAPPPAARSNATFTAVLTKPVRQTALRTAVLGGWPSAIRWLRPRRPRCP